jgi:RsiW-degrading membrane proteinase PrsW (M82 family)
MNSNDPRNTIKAPGGKPTAAAQQPTQSQLFPLSSQNVHLMRRRFFAPAVVTLIAVVAMFAAGNSPDEFNIVLGVYLGLVGFYAVYLICGRYKPWWVLAGACGVTMLLIAPVLALPYDTLPCQSAGEAAPLIGRIVSFVILFVFMALIAGLPEELLKSVPVFIAKAIGKRSTSSLAAYIKVADPLDGILLGAASGLGFTLVETLGRYVPAQVAHCSSLEGLQLLLPRTIGSLVGHMAYSGYFGYFIGLSALRPERKWKTLLVGYLSAAALHTFWNAGGAFGSAFLIIPGGLALVCFGSAIVRARQLAGIGSTVFSSADMAQIANAPANVAQPLQPVQAAQTVQSAQKVVVKQEVVTDRPSVLQIGTARIQLSVGVRVRESEIPGLVPQSPDGVVAEVNRSPNDPSIIGLMNRSVSLWSVLDPKSGIRKIEPGKSARLLVGTRINFGSIFGEVR